MLSAPSTEIDKTIHDLQKVRDFFVSEEERMRKEIAEYLKNQSSISSMRAMLANIANIGSVISDVGKAPNSQLDGAQSYERAMRLRFQRLD
jgi:hypothetical protein